MCVVGNCSLPVFGVDVGGWGLLLWLNVFSLVACVLWHLCVNLTEGMSFPRCRPGAHDLTVVWG